MSFLPSTEMLEGNRFRFERMEKCSGDRVVEAAQAIALEERHLLPGQQVAAEVSGRLNPLLDHLTRVELLIIDELGYLSLTKQTAKLFFQLVSKRYERASVIVTSNKPFEQWGEIFNDEVVASAILDRLLHHSYPFLINGRSFRMKSVAKAG